MLKLLQAGEDVLEAVILGVNEFGQLQVLDDSENIRTFNVLPIFPAAGGAAPGALTDSWTMTVVGTPSESFA